MLPMIASLILAGALVLAAHPPDDDPLTTSPPPASSTIPTTRPATPNSPAETPPSTPKPILEQTRRHAGSGIDEESPLGPLIVVFARDRLGQTVGDGQCTELALAALEHAGARRPSHQENNHPVWGTWITSFQQARPGDILVFENVVFHHRTRTRRNGRPYLEFSTTSFDHHIAIIEEVREKGRLLVILHQNAGPQDASRAVRQVVQRATLRLADRRPGGSMHAYRPIPGAQPADSPSTPHHRNP